MLPTYFFNSNKYLNAKLCYEPEKKATFCHSLKINLRL